MLREMDKDRSTGDIAKDLPHTYKTVHGMAQTMREAIYQRREEWIEPLTGEVEADYVRLTLGQQGRTLCAEEKSAEEEGSGEESSEANSKPGSEDFRAPRARGLSERGRGSWAGDSCGAVGRARRGEACHRIATGCPPANARSIGSSARRARKRGRHQRF